ncbi:hypothetical protein [uncultured Algibacter sp.]|uniref:hypothetical protein n=1 Tax=uncultured Algibacter sp. TaxID=298659 RepID=UPI0026275613|nr:hypothetical protein [uncultured Algibacter sp.]
MIEVNETTIEYMPLLKQQLINYISLNYEEASDYSNYSLVQEYNYLKRNNILAYLNEVEYLTSPERLELQFGD